MDKGSGVAVSCDVGHRCGLEPALLWLWCRPAAIAPIRPLAWEPPHAMGAALDKAKQNKTKNVKHRIDLKQSVLQKYYFCHCV